MPLNAPEHIIEVMGNAASQRANGLHPLSLMELGFKFALFLLCQFTLSNVNCLENNALEFAFRISERLPGARSIQQFSILFDCFVFEVPTSHTLAECAIIEMLRPWRIILMYPPYRFNL